MPFATFSDELSVFDSEEPFTVLSGIKVVDKPFTHGNITWSGDAGWLTVTPSADPLPLFKLENNQLVTFKYVNVKNVQCATFHNWTNRDLIVGLDTGEIRIWNIREKRTTAKVDVESKESVDFLACSLDDMCLASGSLKSNKIGLHSLRTNRFFRSLEFPDDELTSCLRFCQCKKGYLAASTSASTICVWDIITSDVVHKVKNAHLGACSGLEFSPVNFSVLVTVSLSHQLKLYDLRMKDRIFEIKLNEPLHCVDMFENGDKVATGTSSGSVIVFDLRANDVLETIKAHNSVVNALSIAKLERVKKFCSDEIDSPDTPIISNRTLDLSVMDVFSPVLKDNSRGNCFNTPSPLSSSLFRVALHSGQDSFLSKMLSPKPQLMSSSPLIQVPSVEIKSTTLNGGLLPVLEEGSFESPIEEPQVSMNDLCMDLLKSEIAKIQKEQNHLHKLLSDQLSALEDLFIKKVQTEYDKLVELLLNVIRKNMEKSFFEMRYELVTQRIVNAECFGKLMQKTDTISVILQQLVEQLAELQRT